MTCDKKELAVAALRNGTVIDHIPSAALFKAVRVLGVESMDKYVTIGYNLQSSKLGRKGIIKVADVEFSQDELDRIALFAPTAVVNIIRDYEVVEKTSGHSFGRYCGYCTLRQPQMYHQQRAHGHPFPCGIARPGSHQLPLLHL